MKLYLVQHGEAYKKEQDSNRPLTNKGELDAIKLGKFLNRANIKIEKILHSEKLRAQQTAEAIATKLDTNVELEINGLVNPNDDPKAFSWQDDSWDKDMLVVSHLPFLAKLVAYLVVENDLICITDFKPGTIICLHCDENKKWLISWMITPELLP